MHKLELQFGRTVVGAVATHPEHCEARGEAWRGAAQRIAIAALEARRHLDAVATVVEAAAKQLQQRSARGERAGAAEVDAHERAALGGHLGGRHEGG